MRIGVILWRPVEKDNNGHPSALARVDSRINEDTGDHCFRVDIQKEIEPQLISGNGKGLVAISKKQPPEEWTHAIILGVSKDGNLVFIRFAYDRNLHSYLAYRQALTTSKTPELLGYQFMEPGFRRIHKANMEPFYV